MNNESDNPWVVSIQKKVQDLKYAVKYWREKYEAERKKRQSAEAQLAAAVGASSPVQFAQERQHADME